MGEHRLELRERHVRLAIAELPVAAHRALGIADPGAVVDEDGRADWMKLRADEGVDEIAGDTRSGFREVVQPERIGCHQVFKTSVTHRGRGPGARDRENSGGRLVLLAFHRSWKLG